MSSNTRKFGMSLLLSIIIMMTIAVIAESSIDDQKTLNLSVGGERNGDNATIYINISNADNISKLWFDFLYNDTVLNLVDVSPGDAVLSDFITKIKDGDLRIEIGSPDDSKNIRISGNGTIAIINFTVVGNESSSYFSIKSKDVRNKDNQLININIENSTFLVNNIGREKEKDHEHEHEKEGEKGHEHEHEKEGEKGHEHEHEKDHDEKPTTKVTETELPTITATATETVTVTELPTTTSTATETVTVTELPTTTSTATETVTEIPTPTEIIPVVPSPTPTEIIPVVPSPTPTETIPIVKIKIVGTGGGEGFDNSKIIGEPDIFEEQVADLKAGIPTVYSFNIYDFAIYEIVTLDKQNENKIYIRVTKIKDTTKYGYDVGASVSESVTSDTQRLSNILIRFKVNNSWVYNNGINGNDIHLYKLINGSWLLLDTVLKNKDEKYTYFEANDTKINRWQLFAINGTINGNKNSTSNNTFVDKESKIDYIPSNNVTVKPRNSIPLSGLVLIIAFIFSYSYYLKVNRKH